MVFKIDIRIDSIDFECLNSPRREMLSHAKIIINFAKNTTINNKNNENKLRINLKEGLSSI